jgi:hypothetical protein
LNSAKLIKRRLNLWAARETRWAAQRERDVGRPSIATGWFELQTTGGATWRYLGRSRDRAAHLLRRVVGTLGCRGVWRRRCRGSPRLATGAIDAAWNGESSGGRGWSGEARSRLLRRVAVAADSGAIPATVSLIGEGKDSRRFREERGGGWCAVIVQEGPPFIGGRGAAVPVGGRRRRGVSGAPRGKLGGAGRRRRLGGANARAGVSNDGLWRAGDDGVRAVPARQYVDHGDGERASAS